MLLNEVLSSNVPIVVTGNIEDACTMEFTIGGREYLFTASNDTWEDDVAPSWNIDFGLRQADGMVEYNTTRTGDAYQVLSAVLGCVKKLLQLHPEIGQIVFTADKSEPSRTKLYDRLLTHIKLPGWKADKEVGGLRDFYKFMKQT